MWTEKKLFGNCVNFYDEAAKYLFSFLSFYQFENININAYVQINGKNKLTRMTTFNKAKLKKSDQTNIDKYWVAAKFEIDRKILTCLDYR